MRKRPFFFLACIFTIGVLVGNTKNWLFLMPVVLLYGYAMPWKEKGARRVLFAVGLPLFFLLGVLRTHDMISVREASMSQIIEGQELCLAGKVVRIESKTRCFYYYLTDCYVSLSGERVKCQDVIAYIPTDAYSIGQILVIQGTSSFFAPAANEGGFDAQQFYQSQRIDFAIEADEITAVADSGSRYREALYRLRKRLQQVLEASVEDEGVLSAMFLGDKSGLQQDIRTLYQQTGIAHILAISGLHVSLLGMGLYRLLRRRLRATYLVAALGTGALVISYGIMTGNGVSTRRAVGMLLIYLLADVLGRAYDLLSALGMMVMYLLWDNPFLLGYAGFLFSVAAVLGIGVGGQIFVDWTNAAGKQQTNPKKSLATIFRGWCKQQMEGLWISLAIQLFTLPLVAVNYYEIPVYAMAINFVVLRLTGALLLLTVLGAGTGLFLPAAGRVILMPCGWILGWYQKLCQWFLALPASLYLTGKPSLQKIVCYYLGLAAGFFFLWGQTRRMQQQEERKPFVRLRLLPALMAVLAILLIPARKHFELDVLDVGQGDGIYLCSSSQVSMFIDGGSTDVNQVGTYRILPFLKAKGVKKISYWFVSHTDADHINGLQEVLQNGYEIEHLVLAAAAEDEEKTAALATLADSCGTKVIYMEQGNVLHAGNTVLRCLYPAADAQSEDVNDLCLVLRLEEEEFSGLFAGDISSEVEQQLVDAGLCEPVDVYKVDHHGSKYSSCAAFLQAIAPKISVASAGEGNLYGHPSPDAIERIKECGSSFVCTADYGQVKVNAKKELIFISRDKS